MARARSEMDPQTRSPRTTRLTPQGLVVGEEEVSARFPDLAGYDVARWRAESALKTWQGLVDLAIQAHTRRGESDAVANWLYVKLALDVFALEWERALTTPEIAV